MRGRVLPHWEFALLAGCLTVGCDDTATIVPERDEPFVYAVMTPEISNALGNQDQFVVVLTTGTPLLAPCRSVERIAMWRAADGRPFGWRVEPECLGGAQQSQINVLAESCCRLPENGSEDSLGVFDLRGGERYELEISTEGAIVRGAMTMPDTFSVRFRQTAGGELIAFWPRVAGAAGYLVTTTQAFTGQFQSDTTRVLLPGEHSISVSALDENLLLYLRDDQVSNSGIDGALAYSGL